MKLERAKAEQIARDKAAEEDKREKEEAHGERRRRRDSKRATRPRARGPIGGASATLIAMKRRAAGQSTASHLSRRATFDALAEAPVFFVYFFQRATT